MLCGGLSQSRTLNVNAGSVSWASSRVLLCSVVRALIIPPVPVCPSVSVCACLHLYLPLCLRAFCGILSRPEGTQYLQLKLKLFDELKVLVQEHP